MHSAHPPLTAVGNCSRTIAISLLLAVALTFGTSAHAEIFKWEEFNKRAEKAGSVAALEEGVFGEQVNLANGGTSFNVTDVSLPGNNRLQVAFGRTFTVTNRKDYPTNEGMLADWELDVPRISGVFAQDWTGSYPGNPGKRCSVTSVNHARPPAPGYDLNVEDVWQGNTLHIPGVGGGELLVSTAAKRPTDGPTYHWVVEGHIHVACLPTASDGAGKEGFLAITADGTRYWFDTMAQYFEPSLKAYGHPHAVPRRKNVLYASRVEDRHGNWVTYSYSHAWNGPARLDSIQSSDGRSITINHANGRVSTVSAGSRSWNYHYGNTWDGAPTLQHVDLPDHTPSTPSRWTYAFGALSRAEIRYPIGHRLEPVRDCIVNATPFAPTRFTGSITHPAGATAEFTFDVIEHGRSSVPVSCSNFTVGGANCRLSEQWRCFRKAGAEDSDRGQKVTSLPSELWVLSPEDVKRMRMHLKQDASAAIALISESFTTVSEHDFDDFLYDFDADLVSGAKCRNGCAVFAVEPDLGAIYGCEPVYFGKFDHQLYSDFIERSLGASIADKFSLVVENMAWFSLDQEWFAFGSRSTEIVRCWSGRC